MSVAQLLLSEEVWSKACITIQVSEREPTGLTLLSDQRQRHDGADRSFLILVADVLKDVLPLVHHLDFLADDGWLPQRLGREGGVVLPVFATRGRAVCRMYVFFSFESASFYR